MCVQAKAISPESAVSAKAEEPEVQQACETNTDSKAEGCAVLSAKAKCVHPTCAPRHTPQPSVSTHAHRNPHHSAQMGRHRSSNNRKSKPQSRP